MRNKKKAESKARVTFENYLIKKSIMSYMEIRNSIKPQYYITEESVSKFMQPDHEYIKRLGIYVLERRLNEKGFNKARNMVNTLSLNLFEIPYLCWQWLTFSKSIIDLEMVYDSEDMNYYEYQLVKATVYENVSDFPLSIVLDEGKQIIVVWDFNLEEDATRSEAQQSNKNLIKCGGEISS